jgi:hypothetical protein
VVVVVVVVEVQEVVAVDVAVAVDHSKTCAQRKKRLENTSFALGKKPDIKTKTILSIHVLSSGVFFGPVSRE